MFEKEAEEIVKRNVCGDCNKCQSHGYIGCDIYRYSKDSCLYGLRTGYNKAKEDVKHDLMMKLKDEGIVKLLKVSILRNERLSSQEQQELCAWIECAMDFGENLDECATELEYAKIIIQDLLDNSDEYARERAINFLEEVE